MAYDLFRKRMGSNSVMSSSLINQSNMIMDKTFNRDPAFKKCYILKKGKIFPEQSLDGYKKAKSVYNNESHYNPLELNDFEEIEAKYLVHTYYSIEGDNVDYYLQFRPGANGINQNIRIGAFVLIPDDLGEYNLWVIIAKDDRPQFPQYYILKCNMLVKWIIEEKDIKLYYGEHVDIGTYFSWAVKRTQSSYNSGVWQDYLTESVENQMKLWFPTNDDTMTITYNQRFIISYNPKRQTVWRVTKVEDTEPTGMTKITYAQTLDNQDTDGRLFVNHTTNNYSDKTFDINTDYYCSRTNDKENHGNLYDIDNSQSVITYSGLQSSLKIGGSAKTYKANFYNSNGELVNRKPYWTIQFFDGEILLGKINRIYFDNSSFNDAYVGWVVQCDNSINGVSYKVLSDNDTLYSDSYNAGTGKYSDNCIVICNDSNDVIFGIRIMNDESNPEVLNVKCLRYLTMAGKSIEFSAVDDESKYNASLRIEVESL